MRVICFTLFLTRILICQGQQDSSEHFVLNSKFCFIAGISLGYTPMMDHNYENWLQQNGRATKSPWYPTLRAMIAGEAPGLPAFGMYFDFYGTWNETQYPLRFNLGPLIGKNFARGNYNIFCSTALAYSYTWLNTFDQPVPPEYSALVYPDSVSLIKNGLALIPCVSLLRRGKKDFCTGIDIGARIYFIRSEWKAVYSGKNQAPFAKVAGVPAPGRLDFFITIFIGGFAQKELYLNNSGSAE